MTRRDGDRVPSPAAVLLTREARRVLAARVRHLRDEAIPELLTLREDPGHDGSVDDDYERTVAQLAQYCSLLARACAVEATPDDPQVVELGEVVTLCLADGTLERHLLVHPLEASFGGLRASSEAPLGRALIGRRVGEAVEVAAPGGSYRCTIVSAERLRNPNGAAIPARGFAHSAVDGPSPH